jgi:hypothetical protein
MSVDLSLVAQLEKMLFVLGRVNTKQPAASGDVYIYVSYISPVFIFYIIDNSLYKGESLLQMGLIDLSSLNKIVRNIYIYLFIYVCVIVYTCVTILNVLYGLIK